MIWLGKVKAGALQFTMFITVVIALLLLAFIILVHTQKQFKIKTAFVKETVFNAEKGIGYAIENSIIGNDTVTLDLDQDFKTLKIHRDYWGVFEKVSSDARIKHNRFRKIALVGGSQSNQNRTALYIQDHNKPLVLVGNTMIKGNVYLPKQGIRTGNISGYSYYGNQLIYGNTKTSKNELPELQNTIIDTIKSLQNKFKTLHQDQFIDLSIKRKYENSFFNALQMVYSSNTIYLSGISLTGHILIQSKTKIIVDPSCALKDVVLIAPEIEIKQNSKGTFQAIATNKILVGKNCEFKYPTALVLNEKKTNIDNKSNIKTPPFCIGKGSNIRGIIAYFGNTKNYKAQVFMDKGTKLIGEVYCNKNLEVLGAVYGSVYTSGFVANQAGSSYQNHLYNATINSGLLPQAYSGLLFKDSEKSVAKWLY
ncbi:hypothetical protein CLV33_1045 [Jejuia pallidilutea]|uniref:Uncharacterized protein n=1 Tax=Jejuia pallidilutea TaxID=504487 RepID=A0A362X144_9FLAO|nr:hypothetical protein [Jejuia pallidilutea]PQV48800.1 hypothetical protein CLV33_1045 [Jejuia pallidilutea]